MFQSILRVEGNHGVPPTALAVDNHKNFHLINKALLGILSPDQMAEEPFWQSFGMIWQTLATRDLSR